MSVELRDVKCAAYRVAKAAGLFALARRITRRRLRIVGWHGITMDDEARFRPKLFTSAETLRGRLDMIVRGGYPVLPLDEAVARLADGTLPDAATVLTFDDGFHSIHRLAVPELVARRLPATIYLTTYYAERPNPVFRLAVAYLLWRTTARDVDLAALGVPSEGGRTPLATPAERDAAMWTLIRFGETQLDEDGRVALARRLGDAVGVSYDDLVRRRTLTLMTAEETRDAAERGVDVQLHTHRHRFPDDDDAARREVEDNRRAIAAMTGRRADHLCYPSGEFHPRLFPLLRAAGVRSATTCETGLNGRDAEPLRLARFGDNTEVRAIEFEAELTGFAELLRRVARRRPASAHAD